MVSPIIMELQAIISMTNLMPETKTEVEDTIPRGKSMATLRSFQTRVAPNPKETVIFTTIAADIETALETAEAAMTAAAEEEEAEATIMIGIADGENLGKADITLDLSRLTTIRATRIEGDHHPNDVITITFVVVEAHRIRQRRIAHLTPQR